MLIGILRLALSTELDLFNYRDYRGGWNRNLSERIGHLLLWLVSRLNDIRGIGLGHSWVSLHQLIVVSIRHLRSLVSSHHGQRLLCSLFHSCRNPASI